MHVEGQRSQKNPKNRFFENFLKKIRETVFPFFLATGGAPQFGQFGAPQFGQFGYMYSNGDLQRRFDLVFSYN